MGGTASALYAGHRFSLDADHVLTDPRGRYDQVLVQLANPLPYDLEETNLAEYKGLASHWHEWPEVRKTCSECAVLLFDRIAGSDESGC